MSRTAAWLVHGSVFLAGGGGLVYGWMRYFAQPADEFAVVNHPQEPLLKAAHILAAPLLLFACGLLWRSHVWGRIRAGFQPRRRTGILLAALLLPMSASGYLLQVSVEDRWRTLWTWVHGTTACAWVVAYLVHQLSPRERGGPG